MLKEEKAEVRKQIKDYFKSTSGKNIIQITEDLQNSEDYCKSFLNKIPKYGKAKTIFAYHPISEEFPTLGLLRQAAKDKKTIGLPLVSGKDLIFKKMIFRNGKIEPVETGAFGIMEPSKEALNLFPQTEKEKAESPLELPLLILVPGRAFSKNGERMGRGGGFYDRFFEKLFKNIKKEDVSLAGLCFSGQILDKIPMGEFDYSVDAVITESDIFIKEKT
ncbi:MULTISPECIES: 5-formyltetrahydrofolate cyclo-ligase [unclassified Treponema]|uniref:5-formyltetrahydrofolate cyclo-ligase n=1 Tax=unclassified Treponema TaxID=2638727 RepID=UPI0020A5197C|nr:MULTISPECIES: 5-formyltetrahydrofolate cyclo-ligase [unclassified Treponema]UTC66206.1 5-formyltetrahydrofolate cyclo-ligase [Treponema sp. OMZ 789]UTC68935.1 5-formyltetrahydrofolate cyclo-ligase [Treponema sp. OMZ 790]UTC71663.1 5-formyltetrahydrofolate cyclo-ligase [Treponema sp. OMZ 791]